MGKIVKNSLCEVVYRLFVINAYFKSELIDAIEIRMSAYFCIQYQSAICYYLSQFIHYHHKILTINFNIFILEGRLQINVM